ncbi:unnamed protein product [Bursaphelenchus okinawaensis]|uniref:TBC domain-containing protein kinase-like protein n=1 Tax=Bursaphelenchus okinawaensis TaxID=465554 RepID=A0A811KJA1_9BILA|nr:unnamed protein product [Bursaphelenchus okinawaensis]CAG9105761.1 unnamed protein product [Bursaphelenchus okinawaensis]
MSKNVLFGAVCLACTDTNVPSEYLDAGELNIPQAESLLATPPAISLALGRFFDLKRLQHQNLCQYLDLQSCRTVQNVIIFISEHYEDRLWDHYLSKNLTIDQCYAVAAQIVDAVTYLHKNTVVAGQLSLNDLVVAGKEDLTVKLSRYGLYHVGKGCANHVIGSIYYLAPERIATLKYDCYATFKSDIWAIGIVLLEMFGGFRLSDVWGLKQMLSVLQGLIVKAEKTSLYQLLIDRVHSVFSKPEQLKQIPKNIKEIISECLQILPSKRPTAEVLLEKLKVISKQNDNKDNYKCKVRDLLDDRSKVPIAVPQRPLHELYYLWNLCGSDVSSILIHKKFIQMNAPIRSIPTMVVDDFQQYGNEECRKVQVTTDVVPLPCKNLNDRLKILNSIPFRDSIEISIDDRKYEKEFTKQSLVVKERDIDYQCRRMCRISRLIRCYPYKGDLLLKELAIDVPPVYRADAWLALLNLNKHDLDDVLSDVDALSEHPSDRQLHVDIPRCHQYDELMATPAAHHKLKVVLKSWLHKETDYVYWQGLDSLAAPFVYLNFNNLPQAFSCFRKFIDRYLNGFFVKDNSVLIKEYLSVFMQLLAFVDAELFTHMQDLDFQPELFAFSWFLTCFAHVFPLHKIFHLWDSLLLADSSFPIYVGVAILVQFKENLMNAQFNDAILLFSDLPDVRIDGVVSTAWKYYNSVPSGVTYREHSSESKKRAGYGLVSHQYEKPNYLDCAAPYVYSTDLKKLIASNEVLMVDLRSDFLHHRLSIPGSLCCAFEENGYTLTAFQSTVGNAVELAAKNGHTICLIDVNPFANAVQASWDLVRSATNRVCIYADDLSMAFN